MPDITIFHNPACGTSRNTLALIRHAGIEPTVVEYLKTPPTAAMLRALAAATGQPLRALLREKGTPYAELGLGDPALGDDQLLEAIGRHPILLNRPIVVTPRGTRLCRPSEAVLALLPNGPLPPFTKEDGEVVIDTGVRRAFAGDWPAIEALLSSNGLPLAGAREHLDSFVVALEDGSVIGCAALEAHGGFGLLRSVAVDPALRSRGVAQRLVAQLRAAAHAARLHALYLLTTTAAPYFEGLGFVRTERAQAPAALQQSAEFQGACPGSAVLMRLEAP